METRLLAELVSDFPAAAIPAADTQGLTLIFINHNFRRTMRLQDPVNNNGCVGWACETIGVTVLYLFCYLWKHSKNERCWGLRIDRLVSFCRQWLVKTGRRRCVSLTILFLSWAWRLVMTTITAVLSCVLALSHCHITLTYMPFVLSRVYVYTCCLLTKQTQNMLLVDWHKSCMQDSLLVFGWDCFCRSFSIFRYLADPHIQSDYIEQ